MMCGITQISQSVDVISGPYGFYFLLKLIVYQESLKFFILGISYSYNEFKAILSESGCFTWALTGTST